MNREKKKEITFTEAPTMIATEVPLPTAIQSAAEALALAWEKMTEAERLGVGQYRLNLLTNGVTVIDCPRDRLAAPRASVSVVLG
jgi:hypothetical protein